MREQKLLLLLSQSLIGTGFFFLYVFHVRLIFESRTNIAHLTQLEREALLRREDALYFSFYKTLTEANDFWSGYEQLKNVTGIEYPRSVNVLERFHVLPELVIAHLYHWARRLSGNGNIPVLSCWHSGDPSVLDPEVHCGSFSSGQAMQFYLEFVWLLGGLTVFIIYMYGTLLSEDIFGGIYAVTYYLMFHSFASKIYDRPMARENFAFPLIFLQMFYLCLCIERLTARRELRSRIWSVCKFVVLTASALLCWQFSAIIFATQILIMMMPWYVNAVPHRVSNIFIMDFSIAHLLANLVAYFVSYGSKKYIFSWQIGPALSLLCITIARRLERPNPAANKDFSTKKIALGVLGAVSIQRTIIDFVETSGLARSVDNPFTLYVHLIIHWLLQVKFNFSTSLTACNPAYERMDVTELWSLVKTFVVKPYCMYGVVTLAGFFRKWRKSTEKPSTPTGEHIERAKNYVLEDFLEENHISMRDMSNKDTEKDLNVCLELLERCDFDYERYKREKTRQAKADKPNEHSMFIDDIKKLKEQINELNHKINREQREKMRGEPTKGEQQPEEKKGEKPQQDASPKEEEKNEEKNEEEEENEKNEEEEENEKNEEEEKADEEEKPKEVEASTTQEDSQEAESTPSTNTESADPAVPSNEDAKSPNDDGPKNTTTKTCKAKASGKRNQCHGSNHTNDECCHKKPSLRIHEFYSFHFLYSFLQMIVFTILGLSVKKLFFLSFTQGCVIAPSICSTFWYRKQRNLFFSVVVAVFLTSVIEPGISNIHEEYFPTQHAVGTGGSDELEPMLEWIKMNTERTAVFAGPVEIIGTVHLTTRRPIVNHAHLEMRQNSDRTEYVYSVYSRQQSSDIYNQCAQLKVQYLIISMEECFNEISTECDTLSIWDDMQPAYRKFPQFCAELVSRNVPSFVKVYQNSHYGIIKMFSQSIQINLKRSRMPEKDM